MKTDRTKARPLLSSFKPSKWYRDDHAKDKAAETRARHARHATANQSNDERAIAYAMWLMTRDSVDLRSLTTAAIAAHNETIPTTSHKYRGKTLTAKTVSTLREDAIPDCRVIYQKTDVGLRAQKVVWRFRHPDVAVCELELPHWSYVAPAVIDLSEHGHLAA